MAWNISDAGVRFADNTLQETSAFGPAFKARCSNPSGQVLPVNTPTKILFPTVVYDTDGCWVNSRFTAKKPGIYTFHSTYISEFAADSMVTTTIYVNGVDDTFLSKTYNGTGISTNLTSNGTTEIELNTADYVELFATNNGATDRGVVFPSAFSAHFVRPL